MPERPSVWGGPEKRPWTRKEVAFLGLALALGALAGLFIARVLLV